MNYKYTTETNLEAVIMHIATRFINVPLDEYDQRLNEALALVGSFLNIDRVYVFDYDFERNLTNNLFEWCNSNVEPQIEYLQGISIEEIAEEWIEKHRNNEMVIYEDVQALNHDSKIYEILNPQGILSICTIPLIHQNECLGFVGFDDIREKRVWKDTDFKLLKVLAELIVNTQIKKQNEHALLILRDKAIKANEAKSKFLAHMSHEIRNPLNGIHNAVYLLSQANSLKEQESYLQIAQTSLDILISIVNNVLDISKIEAGKMEVNYHHVDLEFEIAKSIRTINPAIKQKGLNLAFDFNYELNKHVILDMQKVNQIIVNLLNNSIKYTEVGHISVFVKLVENDHEPLLSISVIDSGIGISEEDQKLITEAFFQSKSQSTSIVGTGLGLSIVNQLIDLVGGKLDIKSNLGYGSHFEVLIPITLGESLNYDQLYKNMLLVSNNEEFNRHYHRFFAELVDKVTTYKDEGSLRSEYDIIIFDGQYLESESNEINQLIKRFETSEFIVIADHKNKNKTIEKTIYTPISRKDFIQFIKSNKKSYLEIKDSSQLFSGNVLVVDDNRINRDALKAILIKHGLDCDVAIGGYQAIEMAQSKKYDLILMDIQMPQIDGYTTSIKIRANERTKSRTPIVAVTANVFLNDYDIKMSSHVDKLLFKPVKIEDLVKIFDEFLLNPVSFFIPEDTLVVNKDTIYAIFEGNHKAAVSMIDQFLKDCYLDLEKIKETVDLKNLEKTFKVLHYFKGPLSYFGADRLISLINELMKNNQEKHHISMSEYQQLSTELNIFVDALEGVKYDFSSR